MNKLLQHIIDAGDVNHKFLPFLKKYQVKGQVTFNPFKKEIMYGDMPSHFGMKSPQGIANDIQQRVSIQNANAEAKKKKLFEDAQKQAFNKQATIGPAKVITNDVERREKDNYRYNTNMDYARSNPDRIIFNYKTGDIARKGEASGSDWGSVNSPALTQTFSSFTPSGNNTAAGSTGADMFVNMNPLVTGPVMSGTRLLETAKGRNPYGFGQGTFNNILGALSLAGDAANLGMIKYFNPKNASSLNRFKLVDNPDYVPSRTHVPSRTPEQYQLAALKYETNAPVARNTGSFNEGVYTLKNDPNKLLKFERLEAAKDVMGYPEYGDYDFVKAMENITDPRIGKVVKQVNIGNDGRALYLTKVPGISVDNASMAVLKKSLKPENVLDLFQKIKNVTRNNMTFDFVGSNYNIDPATGQFGIFDISPLVPQKYVNTNNQARHWMQNVTRDIHLADNSDISRRFSSEAIKDAILEKLKTDIGFRREEYLFDLEMNHPNPDRIQKYGDILRKRLKEKFDQASNYINLEDPNIYYTRGGVIVDPEGQRKYPGLVTRIPGNTMATDGYGNIPLFVLPNVGPPKMVYPNTGTHYFPGASSFTEYPVLHSGHPKNMKYDRGGEKREPTPYFKTEEEREAYRKKLTQEAFKALGQSGDESYLIETPYHKIENGNNCINGVCGLNIKSGLRYNTPRNKDRYLDNTYFSDAVRDKKEDYYLVNGNFNVGDHIQYLNDRGKAKHSKIIYDIRTDDDGIKRYYVIHNGGGSEFYEDSYTEDELKNMISGKEMPSGPYKSIIVNRPGYSLDKEKIQLERAAMTSPEARKAISDRKANIEYELKNNPEYFYSIRNDSPYYNKETEGMKEFMKYANNDRKHNILVKKLDKVGLSSKANKNSIHNSLLNVFGILGQENKYDNRWFGGDYLVENTYENLVEPEDWSVGPGQIKFNQINQSLKKQFDINKPKDLYNWNKLLPLMVAMDLQNQKWMENQGEKLSERIIGTPGLGANDMKWPVERMSPYFWRGPGYTNLRNTLGKEYDKSIEGFRLSNEIKDKEREEYIRNNIRKYQKVFDPGSYGQNVYENIDNNLQRVSSKFEQEKELAPIVITYKKKNGGELFRMQDAGQVPQSTQNAMNDGAAWLQNWYKQRMQQPKFKEVAQKRYDLMSQRPGVMIDDKDLARDRAEAAYDPVKDKFIIPSMDTRGSTDPSIWAHEFNHRAKFKAPQDFERSWVKGYSKNFLNSREAYNKHGMPRSSFMYIRNPYETEAFLTAFRKEANLDPNKSYSREEMLEKMKPYIESPSYKDIRKQSYDEQKQHSIKRFMQLMDNDPEKVLYLHNGIVGNNRGNMIPMAKKGGTMLPSYQTRGSVMSTADSVRHQANKILQYEQLRGGPGGTPLPYYSDPKYMKMLMDTIYPQVKNILPNASAMEAGEAMDFIFNAGWDKDNKKILRDPRAYALQEYYKQYDPSKLDKDGKWPGRKNPAYSFDQEYNSTIGKLPENQRRVMMNRGRDWYYKNINNPAPGVPNDDYYNTWYGRIWNTNDFQPFNPYNLNFTPKKEQGGEMIRRADGSYSERGLWDNIRANKGSGKKPSKEMIEQERKIKAKNK